MLTVEIPIRDPKNPPVVKFSDRCVNCGKPKHVVMPMKLTMGVQKRGKGVLMDFPVPLCAECERREHHITNVTLVPFLMAGLILGAMAFITAWLFAPQGQTAQTIGFDLVVGGLAGLIVGLIGGTVVEFGLEFVFCPGIRSVAATAPPDGLQPVQRFGGCHRALGEIHRRQEIVEIDIRE